MKSAAGRRGAKARVRARGVVRARTYPLMERAVEEGLAYGWRRAHKHTSTPREQDVLEAMRMAVINEICEWFEFDAPEE